NQKYCSSTDVVIRSATEPEVNPKPYSTSQGANQDIRARKMPYLTNQEGLNHEANFYGFYTQEGVQTNWNWAKIFTEQDVMNFTTQRFLSLSICEYPTLEGDLSSSKERPEANPVIKFKSILSAFQKAKDQEKWTRKSEDMFNLPEPVKPVLHSPQLEANCFNQIQTRNWRPGDHFNQSGGILEVLSCTRTQEISRFNGESLKSNRSYLWKDWTIFRFDPFQAIPIQPGEPDDVQTKPRHPGDIIQEPEEFYNFIPCTSPHRNKKIPIITKLPYLESLAFKLQQLFFYQGKDEISIYQAFKKVPRKLSYPLKPSRFKKNQVSHLEPKSHKRLQRLVSDFVETLVPPFYQFVGYPPCAYNILVSELKLLTKGAMVGEAHGQTLEATLSQQLIAIQELNDKIAQLGKRNKPQGRRPQHRERRFGDAPETGYVEPKPPDPSWITSHHTSSTYKYLTHSYLYFKSVNEVKIYSFSGSSWPDDYLSWERTMDDWFSYQGVPKKERLAHAIKQLSGKAYSWWKRVDKTHGKSPEEVVTNWKDLKDVMIRKYVTTLPTQETRRKYPRRFSNGVSKEAKKVVPQQGHRSLIYQDQIRPSQMPTVLYDKYQPYEVPKSMEKNLFSPDTLARHKEKSDKPILQGKAKVSPILDKFVYNSSPTSMSHLSLSKNVKTGPEVQKDTNSTSLLESKAGNVTGTKEQEFKEEEPPGVTLEMDQKIVQETMQSILLKEAKPKQCQGKALESQKRMKADLLYLGADYTVSRSKPCQEGGDDVVIRSATEPEVNPKPYSTSQGANQDIRARKMPYLTNQEGLNHEANFYGFYTQEGVQANWNWAKIFTEQDVMNFTTQRFLSLSICEYPTLEGDLSSSKERTEANPVIKFKSILSAFQKDKDQEKWTRKSEDMFNLPEPVKPVLHSPQLEANRFNQLQTRNWRPGDHFNQSGGIPSF
ncbi:hypothetical protein IGI04_019864, partial [Brassica rapa subsp. trilocularis]